LSVREQHIFIGVTCVILMLRRSCYTRVTCINLPDDISILAFRQLLGAIKILRKAAMSLLVSESPSEWNNSASTGRIFPEFDIFIFLKPCPENTSSIKIGQE
jgi:hypothetical protein